MLFTRPLRMLAVTAGAGSLMLAAWTSSASAQYHISDHAQTVGHTTGCCPSPCLPGDATSDDIPVPGDEGDLPEVADLTSDAGFASAPQSAVPNAIGDTIGGGSFLFNDHPYASEYGAGGGSNFRVANNNSAIPQNRIYYNYRYFDNAYSTQLNGTAGEVDVQQHVFGGEYSVWCGLASVGVQVPVVNSIDSELDLGNLHGVKGTEIGDISIFLKAVLYQDCTTTLSAGLGIDLPTADDLTLVNGNDVFVLENNTVRLSPYLAALYNDPCGCWFAHSFAQLTIPVNDNTVILNDGTAPQATADIEEAAFLYLDASVGYWLRQDCCGNGIALMSELHYAMNVDGQETLGPVAPYTQTLVRGDTNVLNATLGASIVNGCWSVAPAVVLPLFDDPDRNFDYELSVYVNRRF